VERQEYKAFPDFSNYEITFEDVTLAFSVTITHVSTFYGDPLFVDLHLRSISLNLFGNICVLFEVKTYSIVCVPLNKPTVPYLQHHRAASDGWESLVLCNDC